VLARATEVDFVAGQLCPGVRIGRERAYEEAPVPAAEVLRIDPKWTITQKGARIFTFKRPEDAEHMFDGLRKAGLPER
jgi:hypothetical protein